MSGTERQMNFSPTTSNMVSGVFSLLCDVLVSLCGGAFSLVCDVLVSLCGGVFSLLCDVWVGTLCTCDVLVAKFAMSDTKTNMLPRGPIGDISYPSQHTHHSCLH